MNIKEAEVLTGISKRNIRFYEQKGMLTPARNRDNDYRDYSPQDIERLKLIRALRMVDMPVEEIFKVLEGTTTLEGMAAILGIPLLLGAGLACLIATMRSSWFYNLKNK